METIIDYLHIGVSYYRTNQKPLVVAEPMLMLLPGGKTQCDRILNPNGIISNYKDYCTKAPGIIYIGIAVCLRFLVEPAMFRPCRNAGPHSCYRIRGGIFLKINEDYGR
jgi:hypothetical protein